VTCNHPKLTCNFAGAKPANGLQTRSRQELTMNIQTRVFLYNKQGNQVTLEFSQYQDGVVVRLHDQVGATILNGEHFADVITALVLGVEHIEGLPGYCQCEECRGKRGKALAEQIAEAQAKRLAQAEEGRT
jgi:hypothetical protein